ncbi:TonB-dependent receptor [Novosphingobium sp.]|uniref:TonB-dependent receptor n=1 Tax=Novosphingobium sp. TaxID=1874826 RepID=UPI003BA9F215
MGLRTIASPFRAALFAGVAAASLAVPGLAHAADAAAAGATGSTTADDGNAITVIARKTTETLQNVPVTISAISGEAINRDQATKAEALGTHIPTLNIYTGGSGSGGSIALRGVGSSAISAAFDSAVALDMDGVQLSSMRLLQAGFFDIKQVDVLKGPQSLFFGKSASAGVLSLRSADPTKTWEFGGKASYEFEEHGYVVGGYLSGPVTDTLGIRVAAQYNDISQYTKIQPGIAAQIRNRGMRDFVGRLTLQYDPSSAFTANLKVNYVRNRNDGAIGHQDIYCGKNGRADEVVLLGGAVAVPSGANCNINDRYYAISDPSPTQNSNYPTGSAAGDGKYPGHPFGKTDIWLTRLKMDLDVGAGLKVSSVTGYFAIKSIDSDTYSTVGTGPAFNPNGIPLALIAPRLAANNAPGSAQGFGSSDPLNATKQFTQELRLSSNWSGPFNFMVGGFYEHRNIDFDTSQQGVNISIIALDPVTGSAFDWFKKHHTTTSAYSLFASGSYDITEQLELSGGVRWTKEDKVNTISVPYVHAFLAATPAFISSGFFSGPIPFKDQNWSPEVTLRYKASDDLNIYAAYKTGYKSGGIDNSALPSNSLLGFNNPATRDAVAAGLKFKSERTKGGEIGVKSQFLGRTITLNGSLFYYKFTDLQLQVFDATKVQFRTFNASELTTKGVDIDFTWRTPLEGLRLNGALAYTKASFTKDLISAITGENLKGRNAARAPEWAGNAGFDYNVPIGSSLEFGAHGNFQFSGSYYTDTTSFNDYKQKSYATVDGGISIGQPDGKWKLALVGINLADKRYVVSSGSRPFLAPPGGYGTPGSATYVPQGDDLNVNLNRGRQVFVEASFKF